MTQETQVQDMQSVETPAIKGYAVGLTETQINFLYNCLLRCSITGEQVPMFQTIVSALQNPIGTISDAPAAPASAE